MSNRFSFHKFNKSNKVRGDGNLDALFLFKELHYKSTNLNLIFRFVTTLSRNHNLYYFFSTCFWEKFWPDGRGMHKDLLIFGKMSKIPLKCNRIISHQKKNNDKKPTFWDMCFQAKAWEPYTTCQWLNSTWAICKCHPFLVIRHIYVCW